MLPGLAGLGPTIVAIMWTETILAGIFIGARLYCRQFLRQVSGWDDVLMVATGVSSPFKKSAVEGLNNIPSFYSSCTPSSVQ